MCSVGTPPTIGECSLLGWFCDFVLSATALLLLLSAILKGKESLAAPSTGLVVLIGIQVILAFWLTSGFALRWACWATVALFSCFAVWNVASLMRSRAACGCFGELQIHPAVALAVDLLVLSGVFMSSLVAVTGSKRDHMSLSLGRRLILLIVALLVLVFPLSPDHHWFSIFSANHRDVEAAVWVKQHFPRVARSSLRHDAPDAALVVLLRDNCANCVDFLGLLESQYLAVPYLLPRITLISVGHPISPSSTRFSQLRCTTIDWRGAHPTFRTATPVLLYFEDGEFFRYVAPYDYLILFTVHGIARLGVQPSGLSSAGHLRSSRSGRRTDVFSPYPSHKEQLDDPFA